MRVRPAFDTRVAAYADSPSHREGESLSLVLRLAAVGPGQTVLDVSTGTGFTAYGVARRGADVVVSDISPAMLTHTRANSPAALRAVRANTEALGFRDRVFYAVTCRHAFHHYREPQRAMNEMARVACDGGSVVIADTISPDDDGVARAMHDVEIGRDPSHVRNQTQRGFEELFAAAGLVVTEAVHAWSEQKFDAWCQRTDTPIHASEGLWTKLNETRATHTAFRVRTDGSVRRFAWPVLVIAGKKPE